MPLLKLNNSSISAPCSLNKLQNNANGRPFLRVIITITMKFIITNSKLSAHLTATSKMELLLIVKTRSLLLIYCLTISHILRRYLKAQKGLLLLTRLLPHGLTPRIQSLKKLRNLMHLANFWQHQSRPKLILVTFIFQLLLGRQMNALTMRKMVFIMALLLLCILLFTTIWTLSSGCLSIEI